MFDAASLLSRLKQKVQRRPEVEDDAFEAVETLDVDMSAPDAVMPVGLATVGQSAPAVRQQHVPVAASPVVGSIKAPTVEPIYLPTDAHPVMEIAAPEPLSATSEFEALTPLQAEPVSDNLDHVAAIEPLAEASALDMVASESGADWTELDFSIEAETAVAAVAATDSDLTDAGENSDAQHRLDDAPALVVLGPIWPGPDDPSSLKFGAASLGEAPVFPVIKGAAATALQKASLLQPLTGRVLTMTREATRVPPADDPVPMAQAVAMVLPEAEISAVASEPTPAPVLAQILAIDLAVSPIPELAPEPAIENPVGSELAESTNFEPELPTSPEIAAAEPIPAPVIALQSDSMEALAPEQAPALLPSPDLSAHPTRDPTPDLSAATEVVPSAPAPDSLMVSEIVAATSEAWRAASLPAAHADAVHDLPEFSVDFETAEIPVLNNPLSPNQGSDPPVEVEIVVQASSLDVAAKQNDVLTDAPPVSRQPLAPLPAPEPLQPEPGPHKAAMLASDSVWDASDAPDDAPMHAQASAPRGTVAATEPLQSVKLHPLERKAALAALPQFIGVSAPLLLIAAIVMAVLFSKQLATTISVFKQSNVAQPGVSYDVAKQALPATSARRIATIMANNHPAVEVLPNKTGDGVVIMVKSAEAYPQWLYALQSLQGYQKNLVWEARDLCIGSCEGNAARADVRGYTQSFEEKSTEKK